MTVVWENIEFFAIVFARIAAFVFILPIMGNRSVPLPVKIGLSVFLAIFMLLVLKEMEPTLTFDTLPYLLILMKEVLIGLALGFITNFIFAGIQIAGEMIGMQMGFGMAKVIDPEFQNQTSIISEFQLIVVLLIYLTIDGHHFLLKGLLQSYQTAPIGEMIAGRGIETHILRMGAEMFLTGVKIGAPVIVALLLSNIALGIIARTVPQMNVFLVGLPLKISIGILGLGLTIALFYHVFNNLWTRFQGDFVTFLKLF